MAAAAAMRFLLRKAAPALGRGSPALGLRSPLVRALSTAGGQVVNSDDDEILAKQRDEIKRMTAEYDQSMLEIRKNLEKLDEIGRQSAEDHVKLCKKLRNIERACNVALLVLVPTIALLIMSL